LSQAFRHIRYRDKIFGQFEVIMVISGVVAVPPDPREYITIDPIL